MITLYLKAPPFTFISDIVTTQLMIMTVLAAFIALMLVRRTRQTAWRKKIYEEYSEKLVIELVEPETLSRKIYKPSRAWTQESSALRTVVLDHMRIVNGTEREYLMALYEKLGFVDRDLIQLGSWLWWRRLRAASNLSVLDDPKMAPLFHKLAGDRHPLVSAFSWYALSRLDHELNQPIAIDQLPASLRGRRNLLSQVLLNWAKRHGTHVITSQIPLTANTILQEALIQAAAALPTPETGEAFHGLLSSADANFPPRILEIMLSSMRAACDPSWSESVRLYLQHPNEVVRLRALEYFLAIGEDEVLKQDDIRNDQSKLIRRALEVWARERQAA